MPYEMLTSLLDWVEHAAFLLVFATGVVYEV